MPGHSQIQERRIPKRSVHKIEADVLYQSINQFICHETQYTRDTAVTALTGTTRLKSAYGSPK